MRTLTPAERGFLLLTSNLGVPGRKPLTAVQLRVLTARMERTDRKRDDRELESRDLVTAGYGQDMAEHIVSLLGDEEILRYYLSRARKAGCVPITRATEAYPAELRRRLGSDAPGCLWAKGDTGLLATHMIALVGSRELRQHNEEFAREVGRQAALQGFTLVSGNARGADRAAQEACLRHGGKVISVVADSLAAHDVRENVLYLSEDDFDEEFTAQRALSRNRVIHALGMGTFVAQCRARVGGTWDGTVKNLRYGWSPVCCFRDGSESADILVQMGARSVLFHELEDLSALCAKEKSLFDS